MRQTYMIIGGDGFLGHSIAKALREYGKRVITTSRKPQNLSDSCVYLDLTEDISSWEVPNDVDTAFICAAVTSIDQCRSHPEESRKINVENTINIASKLADKGTAIIFPSTNLVFDGLKPFCKVDGPICPLTEYGRQKSETETGLLTHEKNFAIARFTKIFGPETPLVLNWIEQLKRRIIIHPFSDIALAPVSIDFAVNAMIGIANRKSYGIWHISAKEDITYEELTRHLARRVGASQQYIQPIKAIDSGLAFESIPKYTALDTCRLRKELGINPPSPFDTIDSIFGVHYKDRG
jgi:dTDP-4-dehydrorhamnose reductase